MQLWSYNNASYLCKFKSRYCVGGCPFLSNKSSYPICYSNMSPPHVSMIVVISKTLNVVMSSAQEDKTGAGFVNIKELVPNIWAL